MRNSNALDDSNGIGITVDHGISQVTYLGVLDYLGGGQSKS